MQSSSEGTRKNSGDLLPADDEHFGNSPVEKTVAVADFGECAQANLEGDTKVSSYTRTQKLGFQSQEQDHYSLA